MLSINTAYFAMLLQIYKSISEKQKNTQELYNEFFELASVKRIGGSREPLARIYPY